MNTQLHQLLHQNPAINLGTIKLHDPAALQQLNWDGLDPATVLPQLLAYQRLWRLCPDAQVVEALLDHGIGSAHQIVAMGLGKFRQLVGAALRKVKPTPRLTADIHAAALQTTTAVAQYAVHAIPSEFMSAANFDTRTSGLPDFHGDSPTYRELFGPITAGPCNDCESIFSPAAYFVDLMQLIDEYITTASGNSIPTALQLQARRPDLWNILLNCENTVKELPYLQLANGIMASTLKPYLNGTDPWEYAATHNFPFQLPYNKPLEEIRAYLAHFGLSLQEVYAALDRPKADVAREQLKMLPELYTLLQSGDLNNLEAAYGVDNLSDLNDLSTFLQQTGLSLSELKTLLYQGMDQPVKAVYFRNGNNPVNCGNTISQLPLTALTIECWVKLSTTSMICAIVGNGPTSTAAGFSLTFSNSKLFFNLSDGTQMPTFAIDFTSTEWTHIAAVWDGSTGKMPLYINGQLIYTWSSEINSIPGTQTDLHIGNQPSGGSNYEGGMTQLRTWSVARSQADIQRTMNLELRSMAEGLMSNWPMNEGAGLLLNDYGPYKSPGVMSGAATNSNWVAGPLQPLRDNAQIPDILSQYYLNTSLSDAYIAIENTASGSSIQVFNGSTYASMTSAAWAALNAIIRLSTTLSWQYADVDWALKTINVGQPGHWTDANLEDLAGVLQLSQRFQQPVDAVTGLWHDLKTYGRGSGKDRKNFWDQTFNSPEAFINPKQLTNPAHYHPQYSSNPFFQDPILLLDVASTDTVYAQLRLSLSQALQTTEPNLTTILDYIQRNSATLITAQLMDAPVAPTNSGVTLTPTMIGLSVRNMSFIYRMAKLPQWLKVPVDQFVALLPLMGMVGFGTVRQVLQIEKMVAWLQKNQLNVFTYAWLLGHPMPGKSGFTLSEAQKQGLEKNLLTGSQATMLTPRQLESDVISPVDALEIYAQLIAGNVIDPDGLVLHERPMTLETIASVMAQSPLLRNKYKILDPLQRGINFVGSTYVTLPYDIASNHNVLASNSFTLTTWIRCSAWANSGNWDGIFSTPTDTDPNTGQGSNGYKGPQMTLVGNTPGNVQTAYSDLNHGWHAQTLITGLQVGVWYHIAWVNDNGVWTVYLNGVPSATYNSGASSIYQNTEGVTFFGNGLNGQMIHAGMWGSPLSAAKISTLMYNGPGAFSADNLVIGYYPLTDGLGNSILGTTGDQSVNGILTNGSWGPLVNIPIPDVVSSVLTRVQEAGEKQNALALQKLAGVYRVSNTQMRAIHALSVASTRSCLGFSGINAYAALPLTSTLTPSTFTLSFWLNIQQNDPQNDLQTVWDGMVTENEVTKGFRICMGENGSLVFVFSSSENGGTTQISTGNWLAWDKWYYIAVTFDGAHVNWMINGEMCSAAPGNSISGYQAPTDGSIYIGSHYCQNGVNIYDYQLGDVRFWDTALSATALQSDYSAIRPDATNLIGWWPLQAGTGNVLYDFGPNYFDATIYAQAGETCSWQNLHVNAILRPRSESNPDLEVLGKAMALNAFLSQKFVLDAKDLAAMLKYPAAFGMSTPIVRGTQYTQAVLESLADLRWLKAQYPASKDQWLEVMALYDPSDDSAALSLTASLTGWSTDQLATVLKTVPHATLDSLGGLMRLGLVLKMALRLGVQPSYLLSLGVLSHLPASGNTTVAGKSEPNWSIYNGLSASMADALQAQYSQDQLQAAIAKVQGPLWEKERDILTTLLLHFLKGVVNDVNSLQDLYEYLLVDVKMAGNVQISRIEQALDGLQLYVNRCINGLETNATSYIPKAWWAWMGSYREWQANREVYLYPENYADPGLRKAQTPLFRSFVNALNQGQLTEANIEKALGQYLEGMAVVANLVIVDSYARKITGADEKTGTELFVLGRGHQDPPTYYLRRGFLTSGAPAAWTPWEQLDFSIGADTATLVYAFNRIYIFWVQQTSKSINDTTAGTLNVIEASIQYTFRKMDGNWLQPQTLVAGIPIQMSNSSGILIPQTLNFRGWRLYLDYPASLAWLAVRAFVLPASETDEARILLTYGNWISLDNLTTIQSNNPQCSSPEAKLWYEMLNSAQALVKEFGEDILTTLIPPISLFESGKSAIGTLQAKQQNSANFTATTRKIEITPNAEMFSCTKSVIQKLPAGYFKRFTGTNTAFYPMAALSYLEVGDDYYYRIADYNWVYQGDIPSGGGVSIETIPDWNGQERPVTNFACNSNAYGQVEVPQQLQYPSAFTIAGWVRPTLSYPDRSSNNVPHPEYLTIFSNSIYPDGSNSQSGGYAFWLVQRSDEDFFSLGITIGDGTNHISNASTSSDIALNTWAHIAAKWDPDSQYLTFYVNGKKLDGALKVTDIPVLKNYSSYCAIGTTMNFGGFFAGQMSELLVTGVALSDEEVAQLYNGTTGTMLQKIDAFSSDVVPVSNRTGMFFGNTGKESFLCVATDQNGFSFVEDSLAVTYADNGQMSLTFESAMIPGVAPKFQFLRFGSKAIQTFAASLINGGADSLYQLPNQYAPEPDFNQYEPNLSLVIPPVDNRIDFNGPMREYLWELFFHIPIYVGNLLQTQQQFSSARKWYEYVFNPAGWEQKGLKAYWPLDGNLRAVAGTPAHFGSDATGWTTQTFVDGSQRTVLDISKNYLNLDPSLVPQGDTVSIAFWLYGNFPTSNYQLSIPLINAATGTLPVPDTDTRLIDIFLLYNTTSDSTPSTSCYWEAGNNGVNDNNGHDWDSLSHSDGIDNYNGAWNLLVFTKNAATGSLKVYKNGSLWFNGTTYNRGIEFPAIKFTVGKPSSNTTPQVYNALITDLSVWSIELSDTQVANLYANKTVISLISPNWNFRPFLETAPTTLAQTLTQAPAQLAVYHYDPFDPDALAAIRWGAWEKNVFMAYIHNLIGWGDQLFTGDTWEQVSEATMLYVVADSLLGVPPKPVGQLDLRPEATYGMMEAQYGEGDVPEFLIDMETLVTAGQALPGGNTLPAGVASILNGYFCIPENTQLTQLWGLVANRLYKIRHGLNLKGQPTQPALFGPPLNPATLADGGAYGASGPGATSAVAVPYYRFEQTLQLAKNFAGQVVSLGNELLAALEKQDAESLSQLRQTQEGVILNMTLLAKADMVNQLLSTQQGLEYTLQSAQTELATISSWAEQVLLPQEEIALQESATALGLNIGVAAIKAASSLAYLIPDIFGLADGGMDFGDSVKVIGEAMGTTAQLLNEGAGLNREIAGYIRREQEWGLRLQTISDSIGQINAQLAANQYAISAAQQDYSITQTQYQQSQDVLNFLKTKFTNEDLYVWMAGQLSTLYYQAYQMALELAQQAQTCYQYELSSSDTFLTGNPWNDQYKGLLAGDALSLSLSQMEKAYHDNNSRYQEIHKTFSLMQKNPQALLNLKKNGSCKFSFTELDFDLDFPGHYNRKIASISVTIPAVVGPYQNLNATLIQTSNQVLVRPDINGVKHLLGMAETPSNGAIRANWSANQQISISTGINDAGLFQLNFNDPQYLPFEGTGAVSDWELIMPKAANAFDFAAITDVIIQIAYTASPGGQTFAMQVTNLDLLKNYQGSLYLSLRQQYSSAWYAFLSTHSLNFNLLRGQFPVNLDTDSVNLGKNGNAYLALVLADPGEYSDLPAMTLNGSDWNPGTGAAAIGAANNFESNNEVSWQLMMDFASTGGDLLEGDRINPAALLDVILIVPFSGQLDWGI